MTDSNHGTTDTLDTGSNEAGNATNTQVENETRMFTQEELNEIVSKRVSKLQSKYQYDPSEVEELRTFKESIEEQQLMNKNDFEKVLSKHKEKSVQEITTLRGELEKIKVDGALINSASKAKAIAPEQVAKLLKEQVKLQPDGSVVVLDSEGKPRFTDDADPYTVDTLVEEFLASNQYFRAAGPSGTGAQGNMARPAENKVDLASLDMTNPSHREVYKKLRSEGKL